jgi:hypothetical protein
MKKLLVTILSIPLFLQAQDTPKSRWSVAANFSTDINYRKLENTTDDPFYDEIKEESNTREKNRMGYTGGVTLGYNITSKLSLSSGVQFSQKGYHSKPIYLTYRSISGQTKNRTASYIRTYDYIDVPLHLRYAFGNRKLQFIAGAGLNLNILLDSREERMIKEENFYQKLNTTKVNTPINLSPMVSVGVNYQLTPKINIMAEPTLRHQILKNNEYRLTEYLFNYGLNISAFYKL